MHSSRRHGHSNRVPTTKGLVLNAGRGYDLSALLFDTLWFRGQWRELRQRTITLARIHAGERVLDVGCGTGTLALEVARRVGNARLIAGIDPGTQQIASAKAKAAWRHEPIDFQVGVIEQIPFPDQTFDVVLSTLMMHHLTAGLKRQGLAEIARVLKPGGRLIIADFIRKQDRHGRAARFHAGGSNLKDLTATIQESGFTQVTTEAMTPKRFSAFPGAGFIIACKP